MASIESAPRKIVALQQAFVAGVVHRGKLPATQAIKLYPMEAPKKVKVEGGGRAPPTRPVYGHVRISTFPKHLAGVDSAGFMT